MPDHHPGSNSGASNTDNAHSGDRGGVDAEDAGTDWGGGGGGGPANEGEGGERKDAAEDNPPKEEAPPEEGDGPSNTEVAAVLNVPDFRIPGAVDSPVYSMQDLLDMYDEGVRKGEEFLAKAFSNPNAFSDIARQASERMNMMGFGPQFSQAMQGYSQAMQPPQVDMGSQMFAGPLAQQLLGPITQQFMANYTPGQGPINPLTPQGGPVGGGQLLPITPQAIAQG